MPQSYRAKIERNRRVIVEAKSQPCADCGILYPTYVMDFDHVRGTKVRGISRWSGKTLAALLAEIAKCEVVCANCHRIRTHLRAAA